MDGAYKAATLTLRCISTEAKFRPNMDDVVTILEQLQDSKETGNINSNSSNRPRARRLSADDANKRSITAYPYDANKRSVTAYPRPSASPLYT